jgi:putative oxidoreductase
MHGLGKLGLVGGGNMAGFVGWLKSLGVPFAEVQARMAMAAELGGGILITLGLFTRVGCLFAGGTVLVAALIGHKGGGYMITNTPQGNEYPLNLAAFSLVLFLLGPGAFALDAVLF